MYKKYWNHLLKEADQIDSDLKKTTDRLDTFISKFNTQLTDEQKSMMAKRIEGGDTLYGEKWFDEARNILKDISNVKGYSPESQEYLKNNSEEIAKKIFEFKNILQKYPNNYDNNFKSIFDQISTGDKITLDDQKPKTDQVPSEKPSTTPSTETPSTTPTPATGEKKPEDKKIKEYRGSSIVDFLELQGKPSDFASRQELAKKMGIPDYRGTASQNLLMLNALKGGKTEIPIKQAEFVKAAEAPKIKFGSTQSSVFVDAGGGRYVPATEDQLGDPKVQLYVKNPRKGQGEYLKPNYVKVRREGGELRRQSQFGGILGSLSNLAGDIGNTLAGKDIGASDYGSEDSGYTDYTPKELEQRKAKRESSPPPPPKKSQTSKSSNYQKNPEGVESFFK